NGDAASGDGWRYRGRGLIQVTGRSNYEVITKRYAQVYGVAVDFVANPDLLAEFPHALRSAVCFWLQNGCQLLADHGITPADVDRITDKVNQATPSRAQRKQNFLVA